MSDPRAELGPSLRSRWQVYRDARALQQLAQLAAECSVEGPRTDLQRALAAFDRMRAILGGGGDAG
ncbi:MAG: hypothetical protein ABIR02_08175 [Novosphingobium sp.]